MKVLLTLGIIFAATNSYALHYLNCASADASFRLTEHEIWGSNPIGCSFKGKAVSEVSLKRAGADVARTNGRSARDWQRTFVAEAEFPAPAKQGHPPSKGKTFVLCHEVSTAALDLAAPRLNCKVTFPEAQD